MDRTEDIRTYRRVQLQADKVEDVPELFRRMADLLDEPGTDTAGLHELVFSRDADRDGWPVWLLTAYFWAPQG